MKRDEAMPDLKPCPSCGGEPVNSVMPTVPTAALEWMEELTMRLIDEAEARRRIISFATGLHSEVLPVDTVMMLLTQLQTVDAVPVVRCKDCEFQHSIECPMNYEVDYYDEDDGYDSYMATNACNDEGYCWVGERKEGASHA